LPQSAQPLFTGTDEKQAAATINAVGATSLAGQVTRNASSTINAQASVTANGNKVHAAAATINAQSAVAADGFIAGQVNAVATINAQSALTAAAVEVFAGRATVAGQASVSANGLQRKAGIGNCQCGWHGFGKRSRREAGGGDHRCALVLDPKRAGYRTGCRNY
jgi:hypothetical protein